MSKISVSQELELNWGLEANYYFKKKKEHINCKFLFLFNFPGKNIGVRCHFLLQGIFLTQ